MSAKCASKVTADRRRRKAEALAKGGASQKMRGSLRADCAAPPKTLLYYREREWTSKPCKHGVAPRAWP